MAEDKMLNDILEVVNYIKDNSVTKDEFFEFKKEIKEEVGGLKEEVGGLKEEVGGLKEEVGSLKEQVTGIDIRLTRVEALMVTKDYLDDKLADLKGDLTVLMRKEDTKLKTLVDILMEKQILSTDDKKRLFTMEPFPELML
jgi:predicted  nucleic acid-binding Zn-ribbon protein